MVSSKLPSLARFGLSVLHNVKRMHACYFALLRFAPPLGPFLSLLCLRLDASALLADLPIIDGDVLSKHSHTLSACQPAQNTLLPAP